MGFDASQAVEPLDYDFNPHADAKGTVPEPSEALLNKFTTALSKRAADLGLDATMAGDPRALIAALAQVDEKTLEKVSNELVAALADLCQGSPTLEQIEALPPRIRNAFMGWLTGLLFGTPENPTPSSPATRGSLAIANGAAAAG